MTIIEFVGAPGAGKTTIARELALLIGWPSVTLDGYRTPAGRVLSRREVSQHRWWSLLSQPRLAIESLRCARREGRGLALSWMINLARRNQMMRTLPAGSLIVEEAALSALCLARAARRAPWDPTRTLPRLAHGDIVVAVHTDAETAAGRIGARQEILSDWPAPALVKLVTDYQTTLAELTPMLPLVLHVNSDRPPDQIAAALLEQLRTRVPHVLPKADQ